MTASENGGNVNVVVNSFLELMKKSTIQGFIQTLSLTTVLHIRLSFDVCSDTQRHLIGFYTRKYFEN